MFATAAEPLALSTQSQKEPVLKGIESLYLQALKATFTESFSELIGHALYEDGSP